MKVIRRRADRRPWYVRCAECGRIFDLFDEQHAAEVYFGHDCEEE
jgi:phage terminase large subunit GpA-like protein